MVLRRRWPWAFALAAAITATLGSSASATELASQYRALLKFEKTDSRSLLDKTLSAVGLGPQTIGKSYAVIGFRDKYPNFGGTKTLPPARRDAEKMFAYLRDEEQFDEIFVLANDDFNVANLSYLLDNYLRAKLGEAPNSRFLFVYSGHGANVGDKGYLLDGNATGPTDTFNAISMTVLASMLEDPVENAHQTLILINACYSGALDKWSFGNNDTPLDLAPRAGGAHVIMAGGNDQRTFGDSDGSDFFNVLLRGLNGAADDYPKNDNGQSGDGIITVGEIGTYVREQISAMSGQAQTPRVGDLLKLGSSGSFFFFNRQRQVANGIWQPWTPPEHIAFGGVADAASAQPPPERAKTDVSTPVREAGLYAAADLLAGVALAPGMFVAVASDGSSVSYDRPMDFEGEVNGFCLAASVSMGSQLTWDDLSSQCRGGR